MCYESRVGSTYTLPEDWPSTLDGVGEAARAAKSLEEACAVTTRYLAKTFPSTVLARIYATMPYAKLPPAEKASVDALAAKAGQVTREEMPVLVLLGTHGVEEAWCDRTRSRGHLAIPLISAAFVEGIPMMARLFKELGFDLSWLDEAPELNARKLMGGFNGVFFVDDARTVRDAAGRLVIPAQDFVSDYQVKSVFGMGGVYPDGMLVSCIVFCRESLPRSAIEKLKGLITTFKAESFGLVRTKKVFA